MTSLNLKLVFKGVERLVTIDYSDTLKYFCHQIRQLFKPIFPSIANKKIIIFNQNSLEKISEHNAELDSSLEKLKIKNNSILSIDIDDENYEIESLIKNPNVLLDQQKDLDKIPGSINNIKMKTNNIFEIPKESLCEDISKYNEKINKNKDIEEKKEEIIKIYGKNKLIRRIIPADNSCLFTSINYSYYGVLGDPIAMRELIAARIMNDINFFNEAILEKKPEVYSAWILDKNSWGGGIELSIIPAILNVKIGVVEIRELKIEYFGEHYENVIYILYNGIHYDSIVGLTDKGEIGIFSAKDKTIEDDLLEMAKDLHLNNEFVDMSRFKIKCDVCYKPFEGNEEAALHSRNTGHNNFVQLKT